MDHHVKMLYIAIITIHKCDPEYTNEYWLRRMKIDKAMEALQIEGIMILSCKKT